jgi:hypothetical protein
MTTTSMVPSLDVYGVMQRLAAVRPVFHSEADSQHAFCWQIHSEHPDARVRLETRPMATRRLHLDCLVVLGPQHIAIELKYWSRAMQARVGDEVFQLADHSANDVGRFLYLKDIVRIEQFVQAGVADSGYAVALTNDPLYWTPGKRTTRDAAFRLHEGKDLSGALDWPQDDRYPRPETGFRGPITLGGAYTASWHSYSHIDGAPVIEFRYLVTEVRSEKPRPDGPPAGPK